MRVLRNAGAFRGEGMENDFWEELRVGCAWEDVGQGNGCRDEGRDVVVWGHIDWIQ